MLSADTLQSPDSPITSTSHRVARNSVLYFFSLAVPALAAVFLVPVTVRGLGAARFGLLALAWAVAEGSGMFDFGLGRATVRFVADATARGPERLKEIILGALVSQTAMGLVAGILLFLLAPTLVNHVFNVTAATKPEAIAMFRALAFHLPVLLCLASLRATLEGAQRFDISAALRIPGSLSSVAIPAAGAVAGLSLPAILWWILGVRVVLAIISAAAVSRTLLPGKWALPGGMRTLREMLGYSGWVAVSTALGPVFASLDRFVTGSIVGVAGLGYYTGAAEAANRFLLIPATAFSALLPALAATDATGARERALNVTRAARRQLAALLLPLCLALFTFAPAILRVWLGPAFSVNAGTALRILSLGVFFGGLAHLPLALLYGSGRPDIPAKINLFEVIAYVPVTIVLVKMFGITGAAMSWAIRCGADLTLYEIASRRALGRSSDDALETQRTGSLFRAALLLALLFGIAGWAGNTSAMLALAIVISGFAIYTFVGWMYVLAPVERSAWVGLILRRRRPA